VYDAEQIQQQLDVAAASFVNSGGALVQPETGEVRLSPIFRWYRGDFGGKEGVLEFLLRYLDDEPSRQLLQAQRDRLRLRYQRYDWSLNRL
jgi:hypothetical protein